jgi:hypothetical protein
MVFLPAVCGGSKIVPNGGSIGLDQLAESKWNRLNWSYRQILVTDGPVRRPALRGPRLRLLPRRNAACDCRRHHGTRRRRSVHCEQRGIFFESIHASGHATPADLKRLAAAIAAKKLIPIHTFRRDQFPTLFQNVLSADDGQWMQI